LAARSPRLSGDVRQGQIVGGDQTDRAALHQPAHQRAGADPPVVRVRSGEEFVDQEQHRQRARGEGQNLPDAQDFGIESRDAALQRVAQLDGCSHRQGSEPQTARAHRSAGLRQHRR
jgi:hypothetical protein